MCVKHSSSEDWFLVPFSTKTKCEWSCALILLCHKVFFPGPPVFRTIQTLSTFICALCSYGLMWLAVVSILACLQLEQFIAASFKIQLLSSKLRRISLLNYYFYFKATLSTTDKGKLTKTKRLETYMGFEALHGELSIFIWFAVTPCVYLLAR